MKPWKRPYLIPFYVLAAVAVFSTLVMLLWNAIVPGLTGWGTLTWLQALGLLVLSRILVGGFRGRHAGGHCGTGWRHRDHWRAYWANMTEEQRAAMKQRWQHRCGHWGAEAPKPS